MNEIRIDKYNYGLALHIGRFVFEVGWFPGDELRLCKVEVLDYVAYPKALYILCIMVAYLGIMIGIDLEKSRR